MKPKDKPLSWLSGKVKTPPFTESARIETGFLLRRLQQGELLSMPQSRPMPEIAPRCHELRIPDKGQTWRLIYRIDGDAIVSRGRLRQKDGSNAGRSDSDVPEKIEGL